MKYELKQHFHIESARFLPHLPKNHPCSRVHGHSFKIILTIIGDLHPQLGWVMDYNEINELVAPILKQLDHNMLNEVPGLENPTSELLAKWLYDHIKPQLNNLKLVSILETPATECSYPL